MQFPWKKDSFSHPWDAVVYIRGSPHESQIKPILAATLCGCRSWVACAALPSTSTANLAQSEVMGEKEFGYKEQSHIKHTL